jgi:hypothetical protein
MSNVPRFSVVINGVEVAREWGWDRIFEVKEELKRLGFRWDGASWRGKTRDVGVLARLRELLGLTDEEYMRICSTLIYDSQQACSRHGLATEQLKAHVISAMETSIWSLFRSRAEVSCEGRSELQSRVFRGVCRNCAERLRGLLRGVQVLGHLDTALRSAREFVWRRIGYGSFMRGGGAGGRLWWAPTTPGSTSWRQAF